MTPKVSVLFNEPKLLKSCRNRRSSSTPASFSALQRAEIAEIRRAQPVVDPRRAVSVLFNEPKLLKYSSKTTADARRDEGFSALQRAEIAEIDVEVWQTDAGICFSALQRAEIAEIGNGRARFCLSDPFQCSSTSRNC